MQGITDNGWILIDLGQQKLITGIVTQGQNDSYITSFTLYFSSRGFDWRPYMDGVRELQFMGNVDGETPNHVYLPRAVAARYVRLHPKSWNKSPNLRLEIIGCKRDNCEILSNVGADSFYPPDIKCWEKECIVGTGLNYRGFQNVTNSGRKCQKWDSHDPHVHCTTPSNFPNAGLVENYCRNMPGSLAKVPWCFTEDPKRPREFCPVDMCEVGCIDSGLATVANENDWKGFIQNSQTDDFSDITDISTASKHEVEDLGHQKKDLILQCTFDKKKCSLDDFKVSQNSKYGNCFTFNHDQDNVLETTKIGAGYGLKLTLNVESNEYIGIFGQDPGVKITVHTPGSTPLPEVNALSAEPGKSTFIGLKRRVVNRQPHPYGNCSLSTETSPLYGGIYTYETCKRSCLQKALIEECGCSDELLAINTTICSTLNEAQECCRQKVRKEHENNQLVCPCSQPCHEESYDVWVSSSSWPSEAYTAYVLEKIHTRSRSKNLPTNQTSIQKNLVRLHLYYQDLNYQEIMDIPSFTKEGLFSSLGGLLGLYIGLSVITVCEFCNLIVDMVKVFIKFRKAKDTSVE
ncbi:degenerin-like protein unc-105 [Branchiostoma floridae x Branchiostoma japonicum]